MLDVCLVGTGGMMPLPRRWLTALMTRYNGSSLLIDCGEGTQVAVKEKGWSFKPIDVICFTHYHGDHISGLPGLLLTMGNADRTEPLTLIGPRGLERVVNALRVIAPELPFEIRFIEITKPEEVIELNGYRITAFRVNHNVICYGYTLEILRQGKFSPERAKEQEIPLKFWNPLQKGQTIEENGVVYTPDMVLGPDRKGIKLTYTTDTRPTESILRNARESDLFICEGMYGEDDKADKAKGYKHMTFREAAELARDARVKEMWLTHYSPSLIRPEEYMETVRGIFPQAYLPKADNPSFPCFPFPRCPVNSFYVRQPIFFVPHSGKNGKEHFFTSGYNISGVFLFHEHKRSFCLQLRSLLHILRAVRKRTAFPDTFFIEGKGKHHGHHPANRPGQPDSKRPEGACQNKCQDNAKQQIRKCSYHKRLHCAGAAQYTIRHQLQGNHEIEGRYNF